MSDGSLTSIVVNTPEPVTPEGHEAAMIAKVDAGNGAPSARPSWLPEKFSTVEQMADSYKALEAHLGAGTKPADEVAPVVPVVAPVVAPVVPAVADPLAIVPDPAAAAVKEAGLDMAALNAEYSAKGSISPESYTKLAAAGINQQMVDSYISGQQALITQFTADVKSVTPGGAEKYGEMMEWAKVNLNPTEIAAYNKATNTSDAASAKLAVAGLGARFTASVGSEPVLASGRTGSQDAGDVYQSWAQVTADMKLPAYKADKAFAAKVQAKMARSGNF